MKISVLNLKNKSVGDIDLDSNIFGVKTFPDLIHQYIRYQNAKSRQGSHKTKNRSEVSGRSKKPFHKKELVMLDRVVINLLILEAELFPWVLKIEIILLV